MEAQLTPTWVSLKYQGIHLMDSLGMILKHIIWDQKVKMIIQHKWVLTISQLRTINWKAGLHLVHNPLII